MNRMRHLKVCGAGRKSFCLVDVSEMSAKVDRASRALCTSRHSPSEFISVGHLARP